MTELEKIEYAKSFIDKLANGINPLDDTPIPEKDIARNDRLSRCFFYVSDILRQVIENGGTAPVKHAKQLKKKFSLTEEERSKIQISDISMSVSEISKYLNSLIDLEKTKKISANSINNWLVELGFLEVVTLPDGKHRKTPTPQGNSIGIYTEERSGQYGKYLAVLFDAQAQQFIYDNVEAVTNDYSSELQGSAWTNEDEARLIHMYKTGLTVSDMAVELKRTNDGIRARLKRLGLIENRRDAK